ncbi:MAG: Na+/H+ antiporter subunit E [Candidatus Omnitrophica bacterium]|jgi:multicomponent Na+:H+ antiporter subunit E|nr:Na+/H+ antiporter subunit E [Candidatus Omnitrophota bacterium]
MKNKLVLFIFCFLVWIFLRYLPNWQTDWQSLLVGAVVAFVVTALYGDLFTGRPALFLEYKRYLWFIYFIVLCTWECLKINIEMTMRLIVKDIPINPAILKLKTNLKTDIGLTCLANSLTLTKGAITIDIEKEKGLIYIHWIDVKRAGKNKIEETIERFEKIIKKIFE